MSLVCKLNFLVFAGCRWRVKVENLRIYNRYTSILLKQTVQLETILSAINMLKSLHKMQICRTFAPQFSKKNKIL